MVASAAFMVTVDSSLSCGCLLLLVCSAGAQLGVCFPSVHEPPFIQSSPAARRSCDHRCYEWEQSFSHRLMSSDGVLQGCKREFINPTLTSSPM